MKGAAGGEEIGVKATGAAGAGIAMMEGALARTGVLGAGALGFGIMGAGMTGTAIGLGAGTAELVSLSPLFALSPADLESVAGPAAASAMATGFDLLLECAAMSKQVAVMASAATPMEDQAIQSLEVFLMGFEKIAAVITAGGVDRPAVSHVSQMRLPSFSWTKPA